MRSPGRYAVWCGVNHQPRLRETIRRDRPVKHHPSQHTLAPSRARDDPFVLGLAVGVTIRSAPAAVGVTIHCARTRSGDDLFMLSARGWCDDPKRTRPARPGAVAGPGA